MVLASCLLFVTGCESNRREAVLHNGTKEEIEAEAIRDARSDIARGKPRIYYCAAGFGGYNRPVAIPNESLPLVRDLPRIQLPSFGCVITEEVWRGLQFGRIYNQEILRYLQQDKH